MVQSRVPVNVAWSGFAECVIQVQGPGYSSQQTQRWTLTGAAPRQKSADIWIHPAMWNVAGSGSAQESNPGRTITSRWTTRVAPMSSDVDIFVRPSGNTVRIQLEYNTFTAQNATTVTQQTSTNGSSRTDTVYLPVDEWMFPSIEGPATNPVITGSQTTPVNSRLNRLQPANATGTATCTWQFVAGPAAGSMPAGGAPAGGAPPTSSTTTTAPYSVPTVPRITATSPITAPAPETTGTTSGAGSQTSSASSGTQTPTLSITSLSISSGQPGDSVTIKGSGFGTNICAIHAHFAVNASMDLEVPLSYNSYYACDNGTQIQALTVRVPAFSGVVPSDGKIYLTRGTETTTSLPFHFNPTLDVAQLMPQCNDPDAQINNSNFQCPFFDRPTWDYWITVHNGAGVDDPLTGDFLGHKAEDIFYASTVLKNGWVVDSVDIKCVSPDKSCVDPTGGNHWGAYIMNSHVGTPSPYVDVHWWTDSFARVQYQIYVNIKGPLGVPYK